MAYDINEKDQAIREVQTYLLEISHAYDWIPKVTVDGIYDVRTQEAVRVFQNRYGIAPTGETDQETFLLLYEKYTEATLINQGKPTQPNHRTV